MLVTLSEQQEAASAQISETLGNKIDKVSTHVDQQMELVLNSVQSKLNDFLEKLAASAAGDSENKPLEPGKNDFTGSFSETDSDSETNSGSDADADSEQPSGWALQKQALLAEFGIEPEQPETGAEKEIQPSPQLVIKEDDEDLEALHESIESIASIDVDHIEDLKEQLTSKLRDAEVELSINRAKLSQQWASLEQRQFEVEQRENNLNNKYAKFKKGKPDQKQGILDRLSRHLSRSSHDLDDDE